MQSSSSLPVTNGRRSLVLAVVVAVLASLALALNGNTPAKAADSTLLSYDKLYHGFDISGRQQLRRLHPGQGVRPRPGHPLGHQ